MRHRLDPWILVVLAYQPIAGQTAHQGGKAMFGLRWRRMLGGVAMAATLLVAAANAEAKVEFWSPFTGPDGTAIDALVKRFNDTAGKQAGVEVNLLIIPWEQYYTKLSVALAS